MHGFIDLLTHYPGIVPSALLGALLLFWLLAAIGLIDIDLFGDLFGAEGGDGGDAPGLLLSLGFEQMPFSVVLSGIVFWWWLLLILAGAFWPIGGMVVGSLALLAGLVIALPLASFSLRPLRPLFRVHHGARPTLLVGRVCRIRTLKVEPDFGQAEVSLERGAPLLIQVGAEVPNALAKGATALIIDYDADTGRYRVEPYTPLPLA